MATLSVDVEIIRRDLTIRAGFSTDRTIALVGPSGAGKTSLLRAVAGLDTPASGTITWGDETWFAADRVNCPAHQRRVGVVFQEYALFPHRSVRDNVRFGGEGSADEMLDRLGIADLARAHPHELSGGQRQRVAVARALAREPDVLLLDEPTAALDPQTTQLIRREIAAYIDDRRVPTIVVTHDFAEAAAFSDQVGVLVGGELRQVASPAHLMSHPADAFVAEFTGNNVLRGTAIPEGDGARVILECGVEIRSSVPASGRVAVVVPPSRVVVHRVTPPGTGLNHLVGEVTEVTPRPGRTIVRVGALLGELCDGASLRIGDPACAAFAAHDVRLIAVSDTTGQTDAREKR